MLNRSVAQWLACTGRTRKGCPSSSSRPSGSSSRRAPSVARVASSLKSQPTDRSLRPTTTSSGCWKRSDRPIVYPQAGACRSPNTYMPVQPSRSILACMPNMSWSSHVNESTLDPSFSLLLPSRMVGIVGWDERAFAASFDQRPALGGFQVVVMGTEAVEQLEQRELRLRPVLTVIVLEEGDAVAALDRTRRIEPLESALLVRIGTSTEVRHPHHLAAFRDDRSEERIARVEQIPDRRNRDRPVAGDLTDLVAGGGPAEQPGEVDAHQQLRPGTAPLLHVIRALTWRASSTIASAAYASSGSRRPSERATLNSSSRMGSSAVMISAMTSGLSRRRRFPAPSVSLQVRKLRRSWMQRRRASRSVTAA